VSMDRDRPQTSSRCSRSPTGSTSSGTGRSRSTGRRPRRRSKS
jgi:hypothetical protein